MLVPPIKPVRLNEPVDFFVAATAVKDDGLLWGSYPKKSTNVESDLWCDVVWEVMKPSGWRAVTQISIDDIWSALRYRPEARVGKLADSTGSDFCEIT